MENVKKCEDDKKNTFHYSSKVERDTPVMQNYKIAMCERLKRL